MSDNNNIEINMVELVNIAAKILDQIFIKSPKDKVKPLFKELKQGKKHALGTIEIKQRIKPALSLALDYSEFCGPGFNFDAVEIALKSILTQISQKFRAKADLNFMTSKDNSVLIHLPGIISIKEQLNVMVLVLELGNMKEITIKLMFVDPTQYDALRKDKKAD
ncbi:MAG: hypothetical protein WCY88_14510 [Spongiibacteraceae bacterium]